ncbi:hypothetical protein [Rhodoglobus aureus]|uniref:Uncharacterized protein n=1 Tax=Rhodoglobus aureus TaxID=191497 RepID=A0ABN1VVI4_9MICO
MRASDISRYVRDSAMGDPEFARLMRYFTGTIKIGVGDDDAAFHFADGALTADESVPADDESEILARGTHEHWDRMLEGHPIPFYQCLQTTSIRHGLYLNNTSELYAYLPALNRLTSLLRAESVRTEGAVL